MILVTGSQGLLGRELVRLLRSDGIEVREFDFRRDPTEDIRNRPSIERALVGVNGVVHLAAVSRVVWAQQRPDLAQSINVGGLHTLLSAMTEMDRMPWLVFASSREVYGQANRLPVREDAGFRPLNVYANTKVRGEQIIEDAKLAGLAANICRFSNVYGSIEDHSDRVAVAFARTAAFGGTLRIEGADNVFDFTHVSDVAIGLHTLVRATAHGEALPPIHFVSGEGTTLGNLAHLSVQFAENGSELKLTQSSPRTFDVSEFVGDPGRARSLLGWTASTRLPSGFGRFVRDFRTSQMSLVSGDWLDQLAP
jgi:nucleoside-diphosphate-sugar epimerase